MDYLSTVSLRKLYKDVCDSLFPAPRYRELYKEGPGQDVLKRVKRMAVKPGVKSFVSNFIRETYCANMVKRKWVSYTARYLLHNL